MFDSKIPTQFNEKIYRLDSEFRVVDRFAPVPLSLPLSKLIKAHLGMPTTARQTLLLSDIKRLGLPMVMANQGSVG